MLACPECRKVYPNDATECAEHKCSLVPTEILPEEDPLLVPGAMVGEYRIDRKLGSGTFGDVYAGEQPLIGKRVAIKVLSRKFTSNSSVVSRFVAEARAVNRIRHRNIIDIFSFGRFENNQPYFVMELLDGMTLRELLDREQRLRVGEALPILRGIADALDAAHEAGITHRDLKPDNIFLCGAPGGDRTKILDFGSVRDNSEGAKKLTAMGTTIGSPFYMSPEQAQALDSLDHRADVWSLAAITFECLTGKVPFSGPTGPAILLSILNNDPKPPSEVGAAHHVPLTLDPVMEEALVKDASIRIPTVGSLVDRIGQAYGLSGSHEQWANLPEAELAAQIQIGLPEAIERYREKTGSVPDIPAANADLRVADPFKASSEGGPSEGDANDGTERASLAKKKGPAFEEDIVMGVPQRTPKWILAAIAGAAVIVGAVVVFLMAR